MEITKQIDNKNFILKLKGTFTATDCNLLQKALDEAVKSFCSNVLIDMQELENITPGGQRIVLYFLGQLQSLEMTLVLYQVNEAILNTLEESGMINFIQIATSLEEAKAIR